MNPQKLLRTLAIFLITVGVIWLSSALFRRPGKADLTAGESSKPLRTLRVQLKWLDQAQFAGFYVASEKGFFRKKGLDVTLIPGGPGNNALTAVLSGAADVGIWGAEQVLINKAQGKPITAIGVVYQESPACWMVPASSAVRSLRDLTTQTVGVQATGTDFDILYRAAISKLKINRRALKERQVDFNLSLFTSGQVDVWPSYVTNEPLTMESQNIKVRCISAVDSGIDFYGDTIITSDRLLQEREQDLRGFMWAAVEGWEYALGHADEAVDITLHRNRDLPKPVQLRMLQESAGLIRPAGQKQLLRMSTSRWSSMQETLINLGLMERQVDLDSVFNNCLLPQL